MERLFAQLQLTPDNLDLYKQALTHPSANKASNYERLEYLGDAVIELISTCYIYEKFPKYPEGKMTKLRALVVSRVSLASFAEALNLGQYMLFSSGEMKNKGNTKASNLSNSFEALVGATYLDKGYDEAQRIFLYCAQEMLDLGYKEKTGIDNPKGKLQELLQGIVPIAPSYVTLSEAGPDHSKKFIVQVFWLDVALSKGEGSSKKTAESDAALNTLLEESWKGVVPAS